MRSLTARDYVRSTRPPPWVLANGGARGLGDVTALEGPFDFVGDAVSAVEHVAGDVVGGAIDLVGSALDLLPSPARKALGWAAALYASGVTFGLAGAAMIEIAGHAAEGVAQGHPLVQAIVDAGKQTLSEVKSAAPYVQLGLTFIPGVGQAASAALGAAIALSEGRGITDALMAAAKGACPGGPVAVDAFEAGVRTIEGLAEGQSLKDAAGRAVLETVREELVAHGGQAAAIAFDTALALAQGKRIQDAAIDAGEAVAKGLLPDTPEAGAALLVTGDALRGNFGPATLEGAARELAPLAPENLQNAWQTADDVYLKAQEYTARGYAVVRDVHSMLFVHADPKSASAAARIASGKTIGMTTRQAMEFDASAGFSIGGGGDGTSSASQIISATAPTPISTATRIASSTTRSGGSLVSIVGSVAPKTVNVMGRFVPPEATPPPQTPQQLPISSNLQRMRATGLTNPVKVAPMSTGTKVAIGAGVVGVGVVAWLLLA